MQLVVGAADLPCDALQGKAHANGLHQDGQGSLALAVHGNGECPSLDPAWNVNFPISASVRDPGNSLPVEGVGALVTLSPGISSDRRDVSLPVGAEEAELGLLCAVGLPSP